MTARGATLLQIHYHNRPCGVTTVMRMYAEAFSRACRKSPHANLVVCRNLAPPASLTGVDRIVDVKDCGYRFFRRKAPLVAAKKRIVRALTSIIRDRTSWGTVVVLGHNLNLGKNCALSCAFAETARRFSAARNAVRFFSIVHDCAEEGRVDLLRHIQTVHRLGVDIWDDLYPSVRNLRYATPNARNYAFLKDAGYPAALLRNPVECAEAGARSGIAAGVRLAAALREIAKEENVRMPPSRPILLYPSRVISRKNPIEAVLLAHVMFKSCLLLGATGASAKNASLARALESLCMAHDVPVLFEAGRVALRAVSGKNTFALLYDIADQCVTTSIAEGFGFAMYEPALHGKKLIGRFPDGFPGSGKRDFPFLYKRLLVPCSWIDTAALRRKYHDRLTTVPGWDTTLPDFNPFSRKFNAAFIRGKGIDFGCLDAKTQLAVLKRCLEHPRAAKAWKEAFPSQTKRLLASFRSNRRVRACATASSGASFARAFMRCYFGEYPVVKHPAGADPKALLRKFCRLEHFRLLMTPERIGDAAP
jgi:hypothetical protein